MLCPALIAALPTAARPTPRPDPRLGRPENPAKTPTSATPSNGVPDGEPTDEALMQRFRSGERAVFRLLVARHQDRVFHFILRQVRQPETAAELVQETFLRIVKNADSFRAEARFSTWVFTIARNLCVDALRRQKHRNTVALDAPLRSDESDGATMLDRVKDLDPLQDDRLGDRRFSAALREALASLPSEQREVFLMRELEGLKFREIADVVGVPENTVKSRMRYALEALRQRLGVFGVD
ncbi:MAG: RNA polymerase sigma factor [Deltaproteobacteria bacterium]|nr:RNA polymerase sigma factor [Deltaproteobacteria bacterium]